MCNSIIWYFSAELILILVLFLFVFKVEKYLLPTSIIQPFPTTTKYVQLYKSLNLINISTTDVHYSTVKWVKQLIEKPCQPEEINTEVIE